MKNYEKYLELIGSLKSVAKAKGWTYKRLAEEMKLSEPTVKRIFQGTPCSVDKLTTICDLLEISFTDLVQLSSDKGPPKFFFTREQDNFFAENMDCYAFFYALYYEIEGSLAALQQKWGLSDEKAFRYLRKLEKLGFLDLRPNNEYTFKVQGQLNVIDDGALINSDFIKREWLEFTRSAANHSLDKGYLFRIAGLQLCESTYDQFVVELKTLSDRYNDRGAREEVLSPEKDRKFYAYCLSAGPWKPTEMKKLWELALDDARKKKEKK